LFKLILYLGLTLVGIVAALISPVAGAIAAVEGYLLNPAIFELPGNPHFQQWVTIAFFAGVFLYRGPALPRVGREGSIIWSLWIFLAIAALGAVFAEYSSAVAFTWLWELVKTVVMATLLVKAIRTEQHVRWLLIACIVGVLHAATLHVVGAKIGYIGLGQSREYGVLPDDQTAVMVCFMPLLIIVASTGQTKWERLLALCTIPMALDSIVNTYQRTGLVCIVAEVGLLVLFSGMRVLWRILPIGILGGALFIVKFTPTDYWNWMKTLEAPTEEASADSRLIVNRGSIAMLLHHPMGVGYRNYPVISPQYLPASVLSHGARSAHNSFFTIICENGVFGFCVWIFSFAGAIVYLRRIRKSSRGAITPLVNYALALEVGLFGWAVNGLSMAEHEVDPAYWFLALTVVMVRLHHQAKLQAPNAAPETVPVVASSIVRSRQPVLLPSAGSPLPRSGM
jgi:hypothetical protein